MSFRAECVAAAADALYLAKEDGHPLWDENWPNISSAEICLDAILDKIDEIAKRDPKYVLKSIGVSLPDISPDWASRLTEMFRVGGFTL